MSFRKFVEQDGSSTNPATHANLDQTRRTLGISKDNWSKVSGDEGGIYYLGNYLFPNGLWFGSVSVKVISPQQNVKVKTKSGVKEKPYVRVKVLASKAANKEMIYRYRDGKPIEVNDKIGDFVSFIPLEDLVGFGFNQITQNQGMGGGMDLGGGMPPLG